MKFYFTHSISLNDLLMGKTTRMPFFSYSKNFTSSSSDSYESSFKKKNRTRDVKGIHTVASMIQTINLPILTVFIGVLSNTASTEKNKKLF